MLMNIRGRVYDGVKEQGKNLVNTDLRPQNRQNPCKTAKIPPFTLYI